MINKITGIGLIVDLIVLILLLILLLILPFTIDCYMCVEPYIKIIAVITSIHALFGSIVFALTVW